MPSRTFRLTAGVLFVAASACGLDLTGGLIRGRTDAATPASEEDASAGDGAADDGSTVPDDAGTPDVVIDVEGIDANPPPPPPGGLKCPGSAVNVSKCSDCAGNPLQCGDACAKDCTKCPGGATSQCWTCDLLNQNPEGYCDQLNNGLCPPHGRISCQCPNDDPRECRGDDQTCVPVELWLIQAHACFACGETGSVGRTCTNGKTCKTMGPGPGPGFVCGP